MRFLIYLYVVMLIGWVMVFLFHVQHESFQVFSFGMVDVDGVVGRLVQLMEDAHLATGRGCCCEDCRAELVFVDCL